MYAIYGNIYHQYTPKVSICIYIYMPYMDPMGYSDFTSTAHSKSFFSPTAHRSRQPTYHLVIKHGKSRILYPLVICQNSYWTWPFIVDFPMKNMVIFHSFFVTLTRPGTSNKIGDLHHLTNKTPPRGCLMEISDIDQLPLSMLQEEVTRSRLVKSPSPSVSDSTCFLHKIHPSHEKTPQKQIPSSHPSLLAD